MNIDQRDKIIFGESYNPATYRDGLRYFKKLRRHELRLLLDKHIFDPYPWRKYMEYVWFMEKYGDDDKLYLHGFVYSADRNDAKRQGGIVIEGIGRDAAWSKDSEGLKVFKFLFEGADHFELDPPYVWYD
ncbi:MAG: hypothetical protein IJ153_04295 [Clostridia bacterium]|nr:hypothetical protein [Clostridia bacterium]